MQTKQAAYSLSSHSSVKTACHWRWNWLSLCLEVQGIRSAWYLNLLGLFLRKSIQEYLWKNLDLIPLRGVSYQRTSPSLQRTPKSPRSKGILIFACIFEQLQNQQHVWGGLRRKWFLKSGGMWSELDHEYFETPIQAMGPLPPENVWM